MYPAPCRRRESAQWICVIELQGTEDNFTAAPGQLLINPVKMSRTGDWLTLCAYARGQEKMPAKIPNPVDVHVGSRLRMRRTLIGMSQEKLGERLAVTFQQVQKYEKGSNRISASRLFDISLILDVPVQFFFDGIRNGNGTTKPEGHEHTDAFRMSDFLSSPNGMQLIRTFSEIGDAEVRRNIIDLVKSISDSNAR